MTTAGKAAAAALGTGGVVTLGCYACGVFDGNGETSTEVTQTETATTISWSPLTKDSDFSSAYEDNKVGKEYGKYLTGTGETNQKWWEESYKQYGIDKSATGDNVRSFSDHFGNEKVASAYSTEANNTTALNKVCGEAYKKTLTSDVDFDSTDSTNNTYKLAADILKYCSPLGKKPVIIANEDSTYGDNTIGKTSGHTSKLAGVDDTNNENKGFWDAQNVWFAEQGSSEIDSYFGQFFTGENNNKQLKPDQNIKEICKVAYGKTAVEQATTEQPKLDDVTKYCSFKKATQ